MGSWEKGEWQQHERGAPDRPANDRAAPMLQARIRTGIWVPEGRWSTSQPMRAGSGPIRTCSTTVTSRQNGSLAVDLDCSGGWWRRETQCLRPGPPGSGAARRIDPPQWCQYMVRLLHGGRDKLM
ncbi:hypothetical protein NDU88_004458 [Pleurodeles waltl]|uniref:Uncharacterized protein n=1 Tax=Pleurodeles waltl TaxID=8319 RepID=A0AAV7QEY0_PLEWA|nr:hypothetical protein NDU88_004458 [Pleurodeles waltl]